MEKCERKTFQAVSILRCIIKWHLTCCIFPGLPLRQPDGKPSAACHKITDSRCHILTDVLSVVFDAAESRRVVYDTDTASPPLCHVVTQSKVISFRLSLHMTAVTNPLRQKKREWRLISQALSALEGYIVLKRGPEDHSSGSSKKVAFKNNNWDRWSLKGVHFLKGGNMFFVV